MLTDWAKDQSPDSRGWTCKNTLFVDYPFGEDYMAVWSNHDCKNYDLYLTLLMDIEAVNGYLMHVGQDLSTNGCYETYQEYDWNGDNEALYECEFHIPARSDNFAVLFLGTQELYYTERWERVSGGWW